MRAMRDGIFATTAAKVTALTKLVFHQSFLFYATSAADHAQTTFFFVSELWLNLLD